MTINIETNVRELALSIPGATRAFEELGIDYCCGGNQSLVTACEKAEIPVAKVVESLERCERSTDSNAQTEDWQTSSLSELITHIVHKHHVFTRSELARLQKLLDKVCSVHGQNHPELIKVRDLALELTWDLMPHMLKEEQVLFPYINVLEEAVAGESEVPQAFFGTVQNPIRMMMLEHDKAGDLLRGIRKLTNDFTLPSDACITFQTLYQVLEGLEADLHQHIHLENNILFPRAIEVQGRFGVNSETGLEQSHGHICCGH